MPATYSAHNGLVDIIFRWNDLPPAKAQEIIGGTALYNWRRGLGPRIPDPENPGSEIQKPWGNLTNQEKLTMVFQAAQRLIIAQAETALVDSGVDAARADALAYAESEYVLE